MNNKENIITEIAQKVLRIETLETRNSDSLDFYDISVWRLKEALEMAYEAGKERRITE